MTWRNRIAFPLPDGKFEANDYKLVHEKGTSTAEEIRIRQPQTEVALFPVFFAFQSSFLCS